MEGLVHFQNFVIDVLCKCSDPRKYHSWTMLKELDKSIGTRSQNYVWNLLMNSRSDFDYEPDDDWNIPVFRDNLVHLQAICNNYMATVPLGMRKVAHTNVATIVKKFKEEYLDRMLQTIVEVFHGMRNATVEQNPALIFLANEYPEIFWQCFWEAYTSLTSRTVFEKDEDDFILMLHFVQEPIDHLFTANPAQREYCRRALQGIFDERERRKTILHISNDSFVEALKITGIEVFPHETSLSESTQQHMGGILTRRGYAARRSHPTLIVFSRTMPP